MIKKLAIALAALVVLIQFVPYGRDKTNPPVVAEPRWDSAQTRETFRRACIDCHSNETRWPWYSHVAPVSWFLQRHIDKGRSEFNVSRWGTGENEGDEAAENVREREMPLRSYLWGHPEARLSDAERTAFAAGLAATFGDKGGHEGGEGDEAD
jgi:mono/diheme cytochrome c family protein